MVVRDLLIGGELVEGFLAMYQTTVFNKTRTFILNKYYAYFCGIIVGHNIFRELILLWKGYIYTSLMCGAVVFCVSFRNVSFSRLILKMLLAFCIHEIAR